MKKFYLLRHEDVHNNSGLGVVAEGVIFDAMGMVAMTWLTPIPTITFFRKITDVAVLHGHEGKTEIILEGKKAQSAKFNQCVEMVRVKKALKDHKEEK